MTALLGSPPFGSIGMLTYRNRLMIYQNDALHIGYYGSLEDWEKYTEDSDALKPLAAQKLLMPGPQLYLRDPVQIASGFLSKGCHVFALSGEKTV